MTEEYTLTVAQAAAMLGGTEKAIQRLIYTARLDAIRVKGARGHEFRVRPADLTTRKAELQQRIAEAQPDVERPATREIRQECQEKAPGEVCPTPAERSDHRRQCAEPSSALTSRPAPLTAAEAIPVGVYQELFRRYDQLGRRAAKLECENRHLRDTLQRLQEIDTAAASAPAPAEEGDRTPSAHRVCPGSSSPGTIALPPAPRQLWRSFADRFSLLGGSRPPRS